MTTDTLTRTLNWKSWSLARTGRQVVREARHRDVLPRDNVRYGFTARAHELAFKLFADSPQELSDRLRGDVWHTPAFDILAHRDGLFADGGQFTAEASQNLMIIAGLVQWFEQVCQPQSDRAEPHYFHGLMTGAVAAHLNCHWNLGFQGEEFLGGLVHDVGEMLLALTAPQLYDTILASGQLESDRQLELEFETLGLNHCEVGIWFLEKTDLPRVLRSVVRYHHFPCHAVDDTRLVALVQIADCVAEQIQGVLFESLESLDGSSINDAIRDSLQMLDQAEPTNEQWQRLAERILYLMRDIATARAAQ